MGIVSYLRDGYADSIIQGTSFVIYDWVERYHSKIPSCENAKKLVYFLFEPDLHITAGFLKTTL